MATTRLLLLAMAPLAACGTPARPTPATAPAPAAAPAPLPAPLRWMRRSAEYRALTRQTYAFAALRLDELARGRPAGSWAVILDADETVLDNSEYERRRASVDSGYSDASWASWVRERAAGVIPGAAAFTVTVRRLGGRVVIVTNRADSLCADTRANLESAGIPTDLVLCMPAGESNKNPRFERVQQGSAAPGLPALAVVEWIGDNIQDFPHLTQDVRGDTTALAEFGRRFFVLPNPVYGSWERNQEP
jgi:5'-nucleotidase (lipoprotein e(P4) family)